MEDKKLYDLSYLEEISGGDKVFMQSMVDQFLHEAPEVIKRIHDHAAAERWDELYFLVHKFAPNLSFVGLNNIRPEIDELEAKCKNRFELETIPALVAIIGDSCEAIVKELQKDFSK